MNIEDEENLTPEKQRQWKEAKILKEFTEKFISNQKDLPPEFQKVVDDNFWELLER